jgi:hypothetical protein
MSNVLVHNAGHQEGEGAAARPHPAGRLCDGHAPPRLQSRVVAAVLACPCLRLDNRGWEPPAPGSKHYEHVYSLDVATGDGGGGGGATLAAPSHLLCAALAYAMLLQDAGQERQAAGLLVVGMLEAIQERAPRLYGEETGVLRLLALVCPSNGTS